MKLALMLMSLLQIVAIAAMLIVVAVGGYIVWRRTSLARGARQRDKKLLSLLDPICARLEAGQAVSPQEIEALAARPEIRHMLFAALRHWKQHGLLPTKYCSSVAQGESALAYWVMHPNELQAAPEAIEFVETVKSTVDGEEADFHVYRFRMPTGHWAAKDGWLLGLAGPMKIGPEPYTDMPDAFSRAGDVGGRLLPSELVEWYVGKLRQMGLG